MEMVIQKQRNIPFHWIDNRREYWQFNEFPILIIHSLKKNIKKDYSNIVYST